MPAAPVDPDRSQRSGWTALVVTVLARMVLTVLSGLLVSALVPAAFGNHPTVVMTGSMLPRLVPGDIVFSRPVAPTDLQLGQVLLYRDPDRAGHLRMHRWIAVGPDGRLVTKGDANPERDSTPVERSAVLGVATLRVPFVARPVVWAADGRTGPLVATGLGLLLALVAAGWFRAAGSDGDIDPPAGPDDDGTDRPAEIGPTAADHEAARVPVHGTRRRLVRAGVSLVAVAGLGLGTAVTADAATARFTARTTSPTAGWASATYFTCGSAARGTGARFAWPLGESGPSTAQDVTANNIDGTYSAGGITYGVAGPCRTDATGAVTLNGSSGAIGSSVAADSIPELSAQVWIRTAPTSRGGTLVSFTDNGLLGLFPSTSFAVGMGSGGGLTFAFAQYGVKYVVGAAADLRDNTWHQVTAVAGGSGMALYVDGTVVASNQGVPVSTAGVTGTPRVGYGVASSLGTSSTNYFQGSVAFASLWKSSLSTATVLATYRAAS